MRAAALALCALVRRALVLDDHSPASRNVEAKDILHEMIRIERLLEQPRVPHGHRLDTYKLHIRELLAAKGQLPLDYDQLRLVANELNAMGVLLVRCQAVIEPALAAQGDKPDPSLVNLQRDIAGILDGVALPF
jgi:hypothetical protein